MGRAPCCDKNGLKKGPWTPEEDKKLIDYIQEHGHGSWRTLPKNAGLQRCGKSCRLRWTNYLRPDIKRGRFSFEEEETIIQLHSILGNKWSAIAGRLPGRTDNEIKNYWNTHIRKRLLRMGIDPVTHSPRLDLLDLSSILNSCIYNSSQFSVTELLGAQPAVNPEILRLATSLLSSQRDNQELFPQENQVQNQFLQIHPVQEKEITATCTTSSTPCASFLDETHIMKANVQQYQSSSTNFSYQDQEPNQWQHNLEPAEIYVRQLGHGYFDQSIVEQLYENTHGFTFPSIVSTPTSSPVNTLSSSANHMNSSIEDERDSYCSDMLKFEIPRVLDVNDFL